MISPSPSHVNSFPLHLARQVGGSVGEPPVLGEGERGERGRARELQHGGRPALQREHVRAGGEVPRADQLLVDEAGAVLPAWNVTGTFQI